MRNFSSACLLIINTLWKKCIIICSELFLSPVRQWLCTTAVSYVLLEVSSSWTYWVCNSNRPTFQRGDIRVCPQTWSRPIGRIILAHWKDTPTSCNRMIVEMTHHLLDEKSILASSSLGSKGNRGCHGKFLCLFYYISILFYSMLFYKAHIALWNRIQHKRTEP